MAESSYRLAQGGTGHAPHVLTNPNNPEDVIALCSCGGTRDPRGFCDGTHAKKKSLGCACWYCRERKDRVGQEFANTSKCTCAG